MVNFKPTLVALSVLVLALILPALWTSLDKAKLLVMVIALYFFECFDADGWVTGRTSGK